MLVSLVFKVAGPHEIFKSTYFLEEHLRTTASVISVKVLCSQMQVKVQTFHFHVTLEVKRENEWEFVNLKLKISFCFIFVQLFSEFSDSSLVYAQKMIP